jgi:hypothetical protein
MTTIYADTQFLIQLATITHRRRPSSTIEAIRTSRLPDVGSQLAVIAHTKMIGYNGVVYIPTINISPSPGPLANSMVISMINMQAPTVRNSAKAKLSMI